MHVKTPFFILVKLDENEEFVKQIITQVTVLLYNPEYLAEYMLRN